ncbi:ATP-binding protein, partial [Actinomadura latina]
MAQTGDLELRGRYVAGHNIVFQSAEPESDDTPPFLIVDRNYLSEQLHKPKVMYVARSPNWADVVHGFDPDLKFIERDQTSELCSTIRTELVDKCKQGADSQLHSLFVLGAPGAGKTTLVRRVAALLVLAGECVVADFGANTERVSPGEVNAYINALDELARQGTPVLALLDDPFFANSGWVELLHALSRPHHRGIAILGASPDFLFDRFASSLFGRRVVGRTVALSKPSAQEKEVLALLHDREPATSSTSDDDLLVVAMEAAAGESFREIINRIWMTLNGGLPVDSTIDRRRLPWPVIAFAIVCYFHRNYVLCPEPLLRELLLDTLIETPPSYLSQELQELVTREGWHIFSAQQTAIEQVDRMRLIGATHARVAREAWNHSPLRGLNVEKAVVDVSVRVPQSTHHLAELILALQSSSTTSERRLANRFAVRWSNALEQGAVETQDVCALVRQLKSSRAARLQFRGTLRKCLNAQDSQSWLAAWQLYHLASASLHPQEREFLLKVNIPWTLKIADLSKGPREAIDIAMRLGGDVRQIVTDRLLESLRGEVEWRLDAEPLAWLINHLPDSKVLPLLDYIYDWLENDLLSEPDVDRTSAACVVDALVSFSEATTELDGSAKERLFGTVFDWLLASPETNARVMQRILELTEHRVGEGDPSTTVVLTHVLNLLLERPESNEGTWAVLLTLLGRLPSLGEEAERIVPLAFDWLREHPETNVGTWGVLLTLLGRLPGLAEEAERIVPLAFEWLLQRPEGNESAWSTLLALLGRLPGLAEEADRIAPLAFEWLRQRPESNESAWSALLTLLGRLPGLA